MAEQPPRWRRFERRLFIGAIVGIALFVLVRLLVPPLAASAVRDAIESAFREHIRGKIRIESVSVSLSGRAIINHLSIQSPEGGAVLIAPRAFAKVGLFSAMGHRPEVDLLVQSPVLFVLRDENGRFNLQDLIRPAPASAAGEERAESDEEDLTLNLRVTDARILFEDRGSGTSMEITDGNLQFDVPSLHKPGRMTFAFSLPEGGSGTVKANLTPDTLKGTFEYSIEIPSLQPYRELAGLATLRGSGRLEGSGTLAGLPAMKWEQTLRLKDIVAGAGESVSRLGAARLFHSLELDAQGNGTFDLNLTGLPGTSAELRAKLTAFPTGAAVIEGTATLESRLSDARPLLAGFVPFREGTRLGGRIEGRARFRLERDRTDLDLDLSGRAKLGAPDRPPFETDLVLAVRGVADRRAGTLHVPRFTIRGAEIRADGRLHLTGLKPGGELDVRDSRLEIQGDLGKFAERIGPFVDVGATPPEGAFELTASLDGKAGTLKGVLRDLRFGKFGPVNGVLGGRLWVGSHEAGLKGLRFDSAPLRFEADATFANTPDGFRFSAASTARVDPAELSALLDETARLGGTPLLARIDMQGSSRTVAGQATGRIARLQADPLEVQGLTFDMNFGRSEGGLTCTGTYQGGPLTYGGREVMSSFGGDFDLKEPRLSLRAKDTDVRLSGEKFHVRAELSPLTPLLGGSGDYRLDGRVEADGTFETFRAKIRGLSVVGPDQVPVQAGDVVLDVRLRRGERELRLEDVRVTSPFANGSLSGVMKDPGTDRAEVRDLRFDLRYIPGKLGAVLAPWLGKVRLVGPEERRVRGSLRGTATAEGVLALLAGSDGDVDASVGLVVAEGFRMDARVTGKIQGGVAELNAPVDLNGGTLQLESRLGLDGKGSRLGVRARGIALNAENGNLLWMIHPFLHNAVRLGGVLQADFRGVLPGSLEEPGPVDRLSGSGRVLIEKLEIAGSPVVERLLRDLGEDDPVARGYLHVPDLRVEDGRIRYQRTVLRIENTELRFAGWIGFDRTLRLTMTAPIRKSLLRKAGLDEDDMEIFGREIDIPITGTVDAPEFDLTGALRARLQDYLRKKARRKIEDSLKKRLKGIFERH